MKSGKIFFLAILLAGLIYQGVAGQSREFNLLNRTAIAAMTMSTSSINGSANSLNRLAPGSIIVYRTNAGLYGKMMVMQYGFNLKLKWVTYRVSGAVYSSGSSLVIRGTWCGNLDNGTETSYSNTGSDFFWEQVSSVTRYLVPRNGAVYAVYIRKYEDVDDQFVGYVSNEESRFVSYVWAFIKEFRNTWNNTQYYWGQARFLGADHLYFADSADLAYIAGHGSASSITMSRGQRCSLLHTPWGSFSTSGGTGDLEYIVFHSCKVLQLVSGWRARWKNYTSAHDRPFDGLHIAMGFRTNHVNGIGHAGPHAADDFAENLEDGYNVRRAWYVAARDNRWRSFAPGKNKPAIFYIRPHRNETISQHNSIDYHYGDPEYLLDAYYMQ